MASPDHPYCRRKGIDHPDGARVVPGTASEQARAMGIRIANDSKQAQALRSAEPEAHVFLSGDLLIAARDGDGKVWSLQSINPHFKDFVRGGRKAGLHAAAGTTGCR